MITYAEKGPHLHEALARAGLSLYQQDGVWVTDGDEAEVQAFIDAFVPDTALLLKPINDRCAATLAMVKIGIPEDEVLSWGKQEMEARTGGGPLTTQLALRRGIPLEILLERIIAKADAYAEFSGDVIGIRQSLEDRIMAGEVDVKWPV